MGEHEAGTCKELNEVRIDVARLEENVKIIPELKKSIDKLLEKMQSQTGFIAGISATVSALISAITILLAYKGLGR